MAEKPSPRGRVLIVEDEPYVRDSLADLLRARGFEVDLAADVGGALDALRRRPVDAVLTDLKLGAAGGLDLIKAMRADGSRIPIVVLTGHGTVGSAVECMKAGADNYLLKPADPDALEVAIERALQARALQSEVDYLRGGAGAEIPADDPLVPIGVSAAWQEVMARARAAAPSDATVLLLGESGTGKEMVARQIHRLSARRERPYVRVNCAAVPLDLWESEFFGHRRGTFTGASGDRDGRFRLAHHGTLFMDEVGAMPLPAQAKILRVLQDGIFDRLGDDQPTTVDVRIIAATNSDLDAQAAAGTFRQDLFYRLNVVRINLPPLRQRPEDIPLLTERFVREIAVRLGQPAPRVGPEALADLMAYPWPGNVRELRNVIERALILNPGDTLAPLDIPPAAGGEASPKPAVPGQDLNLRAALLGRERDIVLEAVRRSQGVRKEAARLLGIDQRNLSYYLRKHGIDPDRVPS
jgi:DNA-binding NtrC family response regulator